MPIELMIEAEGAPEGTDALLDRVAAMCFQVEGVPPMDAAARLVDDAVIRVMNRDMRGIDRATDVLSFPSIEYKRGRTARDSLKRLMRERNPETGRAYLGDIVISVERARAQAEAYGHGIEREIGYLTAHALFHLMGYDHGTEAERAVMRAAEEQVMALVDLTREGEGMTDQALYERACRALKRAYVPYSGFHVGACLLSADGRVFDGCNIENASYGATICAERCAVACGVSQGATSFTAIAVVGEKEPAWPCGVCRQVLNEFSAGMRVICGSVEGGAYEVVPLEELLPRSFGPRDLGK